jgi:nucleoside-diphosphate-sugar epimerase
LKFLITGAGGFLGSAVARAAAAAGHVVVGTVRPGKSSADEGRIRTVGLDLFDPAAVSRLMEREQPDILVHSAWAGVTGHQTSSLSLMVRNVVATCSLIEAAVAAGRPKFIGVGSQAEYGPLEGRVAEGQLPQPSSIYGAGKLSALHLGRVGAAKAGLSFAWLRLFAVYGPGDNPNWLIPRTIEQLLDGVPPRLTEGRQVWDYLHVDDAARAVLLVGETAKAEGVFNLGSGQPVTVRSVVERLRELAGPDVELRLGEVPYGADQVWHLEAEISRLTSVTGWAPRIGLDEGLSQTVEWHRSRRERAVI